MSWEILHIPGKPPSSLEHSTVNVVAATIEPKLANTLVRQLNQICPLEDLRHVKRVRRINSEGCQVCCYVKRRMGRTMQALANIIPSTKQVVNAAVIVDSSSSEIIAKATDQTGLPPTSLLKICSNHLTVAGEAHSASSMAEENRLAKQEVLCPLRNWLSHCTHSLKGVACLNPRGWIEQRPYDQKLVNYGSNFSWHPLRHATLVAIENAAARDRKLFPNLGSLVNNRDLNGGLENDSNNGPAKRLKTDKLEDRGRLGEEACSSDSSSEAMRPYLCTGFDIYLVWEPCTMCAMALVHQRIRRVFYASPNPNGGALDSVHRLHGEKSLNHHYSVYRILIPENALHELCFNEPCNNSSPQQQM
ncbi:probable inactive tRNA-specific adenosine deaminase-like protein 3 isoform X3 [Ananas comosus]|uniref:Probable inactive tRNA-specific adenosine deaminase-like protein 3 isoform X3 n=1 Tax=Ananas comosus TaxID=4615 RepID=A0A6P5G3H4_ANACO|nr:probable inactive tRNA-specific adenosine deaminase-like protein 3 isoform X3 [Ananas comosus]